MVDQRKDEDATVRSGDPLEAAEVEPEESGRVEGQTQKQIVWRRFRRHRLAMICGAVLILLYILALVTPWIAPYGFAEQDFTSMNQGPSLTHPMGTDQLGRDQLTRVMYGGRISMLVGLGVGTLITVLGTSLGIISGYYGRFVDSGVMGTADFVLVLPFIPVCWCWVVYSSSTRSL